MHKIRGAIFIIKKKLVTDTVFAIWVFWTRYKPISIVLNANEHVSGYPRYVGVLQTFNLI